MKLAEMKKTVESRVIELMSDFNIHYSNKCIYPISKPEVDFGLYGTAAGLCSFHKVTGRTNLAFNETMMEDNWEDWDQTVVHEVAHFCTGLLFGETLDDNGEPESHGSDWSNMMKFFGVEPLDGHDYDIDRAMEVFYEMENITFVEKMKSLFEMLEN